MCRSKIQLCLCTITYHGEERSILGAYAKHKLHEQRRAAVGSGSTDSNRRTFNRTDAPHITTAEHCTGRPRSSDRRTEAVVKCKYKFSTAQVMHLYKYFLLLNIFVLETFEQKCNCGLMEMFHLLVVFFVFFRTVFSYLSSCNSLSSLLEVTF